MLYCVFMSWSLQVYRPFAFLKGSKLFLQACHQEKKRVKKQNYKIYKGKLSKKKKKAQHMDWLDSAKFFFSLQHTL